MTDMKKMRTVESAYEEIVKMDPDTAITKWAVRTAVSEGYIPSSRVGKKRLVDLDLVIRHFSGEDVRPERIRNKIRDDWSR